MKKIKTSFVIILMISFVISGIYGCTKKHRLVLSPLVITISPSSWILNVNKTKQFSASATRDGKPVSMDFTWSVEPASLGSINSTTGLFTAGSSEGQGKVIASAEGESASVDIEVVEQFTFPFYIHKDKDHPDNHYSLSVWWDDFGWVEELQGNCVEVTWDCPDTPDGSANSLKFEYSTGGVGWGGIGWVEPHDNDGKNYPNGGYDLTGATKLTFWAKCDKEDPEDNHEISVQVGIIFTDGTHPDSSISKLENIKLQTTWTLYEVDLTGKDLSEIQFGFLIWAWTPPYTFYIDEIKFE